jgi:hypothetical protein
LTAALTLAGALIWAEIPICVLNAKASAMKVTPAKMENDLFMGVFLEGAGSSVCSA